MTTSPTHRAETIHIDEQRRCATASVQWLLESNDDIKTHPITHNNHIRMLVCGQEAFGAIAADLERARSTVDLVCWGFDPGMELVRDKGTEWPRGETYGELLKRLATRKDNPVKVRLLIWYSRLGSAVQNSLPGYTDGLHTSDELHRMDRDRKLRQPTLRPDLPAQRRADHCIEWWRWAMDPKNGHLIEVRGRAGDGDRIGASLAGEPTRPSAEGLPLVNEKSLLESFGTHHQKTVLVDYHHDDGVHAVGYVMGLNSLTGYWDTRAHDFNCPLREYDTAGKTETAKRVKKAGGDVGKVRLDPYQDYACRLQGEALECVHRNFASAWTRAGGEAIAARPAPGGLKKARFFGQTSSVQVLRTQPEEGDQTIKKAYFHATEFARHYLYMENQYFQYVDWALHLKAKRKAFRQGCREGGAKGPEAPGILHAFIVIARPERSQMAPRTFDTVKSLGRSDQMQDEDIDGKLTGQYLLMREEREAQEMWEHNMAAWRQRAGHSPWSVEQPPPKPLRSTVGRDAARIEEPSALDLEDIGLKVLIGMLVSGDDGSSGFKRRGHADKYRQIYTHSKLLMIDDAFFTVGSANLNQRSMAVDSEINIATDDPVKTRALRKDVWGLHTDGAYDGGDGSPGQIAEAFANWQKLILENDSKKAHGKSLNGFLCAFRDSKFSYARFG